MVGVVRCGLYLVWVWFIAGLQEWMWFGSEYRGKCDLDQAMWWVWFISGL